MFWSGIIYAFIRAAAEIASPQSRLSEVINGHLRTTLTSPELTSPEQRTTVGRILLLPILANRDDTDGGIVNEKFSWKEALHKPLGTTLRQTISEMANAFEFQTFQSSLYCLISSSGFLFTSF